MTYNRTQFLSTFDQMFEIGVQMQNTIKVYGVSNSQKCINNTDTTCFSV